MVITRESITTPGRELDSELAALKARVATLEARGGTTTTTATTTVDSWVWDALGRFGLTTSATRVKTRDSETLLGWQIVAGTAPSTGSVVVELRVDATTVDTLVWDLADTSTSRSDVTVSVARGAEIVPWVTQVGGLPAGEEITDVSIEVWRSA